MTIGIAGSDASIPTRSLFETSYFRRPHRLLLLFRRHHKSKNRELSRTRHVQTAGVFGTWQVERLTEFATIDFPVGSPGLLGTTAFLLEHVGAIKPALQVSAAELTLVISFVAGALTWLLDLDFVVGKLHDPCRLLTDWLT